MISLPIVQHIYSGYKFQILEFMARTNEIIALLRKKF